MNTVVLKLVSAIVIAGRVLRPGALVEVTQSEARDLRIRGKAELATVADGAAEFASEGAVQALHPDLAAPVQATAAGLPTDTAAAQGPHVIPIAEQAAAPAKPPRRSKHT